LGPKSNSNEIARKSYHDPSIKIFHSLLEGIKAANSTIIEQFQPKKRADFVLGFLFCASILRLETAKLR
jgi:hypothetical protein